MPLYDYLTPKLDFKRKFNHANRFLQRTIDGADDSKISNRIITTNRIPNRKFDSKSNRISKLSRSLHNKPHYVEVKSAKLTTLLLRLSCSNTRVK